MRRRNFKKKTLLPGFGLTLGFGVSYLSLIVLIPLAGLLVKTSSFGWTSFWQHILSSRVLASCQLSFGASLVGALINVVFGFAVAWVLVRYRFPGKRIIDALVDLPFALPTAVAGVSLTTLYSSQGWIGRFLDPLGIKVAYAPLGVIIALTFIGLPFVVRTVQPVIEDLRPEMEEASISLGATRKQTFFKVLLPPLVPALLTGFALAYARALGEYGSVVFISGNIPMRTEIVPLLIVGKLEQYDYSGASALATLMLVISFSLLLFINFLQWRYSRYRLGRI